MEENKKVTRESVVYNTENMTVVRWGSTWAYWRYDPKGIPDEVRLYCLKGFIDDLQDCTVGIKKSDYKANEDGQDAYRLDCLSKRRELERHINEGTRPRANISENTVAKKTISSLKEASKAITLQGLIIKQAMSAIPGNPAFTAEDAEKLAEFMAIAAGQAKTWPKEKEGELPPQEEDESLEEMERQEGLSVKN